VAVQVALVGEAGRGGDVGDGPALLQEAAGGADAMGEPQRVGRQAETFAEQADEAELADPGRRGELVEADVARGIPKMGVLAPPSVTRSGTAGTSPSTCATSRTTRSSPPRRSSSPERPDRAQRMVATLPTGERTWVIMSAS
jgi:hypothetical protein